MTAESGYIEMKGEKPMKKLVSIVLVVMLLLGSASALADEKVLNFWSLMSGGEADLVQEIVDAYNATNPEYKVVHTMLASTEYYPKLTTAVSADEGPDIGISHVGFLPALVSVGAIIPIEDVATAANFDWSVLNDSIVEGCKIDGETYALPLDTHCQLLYYNKDLLTDMLNAEGKLDVPQGGPEFIEWMQKIRSILPEDKHVLVVRDTGLDSFRMWWSVYVQAGDKPVITSDLEITLDEQQMVDSLNYMKSWFELGLAPSNMNDSSGSFTAGDAALTLQGCWKNYVYEKTEGLNYGVAMFPRMMSGSKEYGVWGDSHTLVIPNNHERLTDERKKAIFDFMSFFSMNSVAWAKAGHIVANKEVIASDAFKALPYRSEYVDESNYVVYFEPNPYSYAIRDILVANVGAALTGVMTPEEAYAESIAEIEETVN